jgi:N-acetylmuramoyl-L-alanine amidase
MRRFFRRLAWGLGIVIAVCGLIAPAVAQPAVTAVAVAEQGGATRLVLELSQRADYRVFLLNEPMRLVLELPPVSWRLTGAQAPIAGLVAGYRYGQFDRSTARLVVDLAAPARVRRSGFELAIGRKTHRLVLDLEPVAMEAFAAEVQPWMSSGSMLKAPPPGVAVPLPVVVPPAAAASPGATSGPVAAAQPPAAAPQPAPKPSIAAVSAPAASAVKPAPRRAEGKKIIVLDPGHGGVDPGAVGASGTHEKDVTLAIAREVRRQLEATGRYRVVLTRNEDMFVQLRDRVTQARNANADLFLSIHADSIGSAQTRGASVYTLSETASDAEAAALAARENRADIIAGIDLSVENKEVLSILIDLAQRETMNRSAVLAGSLVGELGQDIPLLPNRPHRFAGFAVLKAPDIPSVLLELGYLSNRQDEMLLTRPHHRAKIAAAVVRAIDGYFSRKDRS